MQPEQVTHNTMHFLPDKHQGTNLCTSTVPVCGQGSIKFYHIKSFANCKRTLVIYKYECPCGWFYVGRTSVMILGPVGKQVKPSGSTALRYASTHNGGAVPVKSMRSHPAVTEQANRLYPGPNDHAGLSPQTSPLSYLSLCKFRLWTIHWYIAMPFHVLCKTFVNL